MDVIQAPMFFDDTPDLQDGFELLPEGQWLFEITDIDMKPAKESGRPRLFVKVKIVEGAHEGRTGMDFWNVPVADDKKDGRIFKFWKRVHDVCPDAVTKDGVKPDLLKGLRYKANIVHEEYQGRMQNRFNFPYPISLAGKEPPKAPAMFGEPPK
jgi:hypothetical protein